MYFVVYDYWNNIVAYIDDIDELSKFVNRRKRQLVYKFKTQDCVYIEDENILKVYKFCWGVTPLFFVCYYLDVER